MAQLSQEEHYALMNSIRQFIYDRHWDLGNGWSGDMR